MQDAKLTVDTLSSRNRIKLCLSSPEPITSDMAIDAQNKDYPVMGYGFYAFRCHQLPDNSYLATWFCSASCD